MKNITIKDIAKIANVSYATVSRALSGVPGVSDETRSRILKICEEIGYTPDYMARSMVTKSTKLIGLIVPDISNPFMSEMAFNIEQFAGESGYHIMLCNSVSSLEQEQNVFKLLMGRKVDGILIFPTGAQSHKLLEKYLDKIPVVFVSENLGSFHASYVTVDNFQGTSIGTEYLYSLGHRNILYFGRRASHKLRYEGYEAICKKYGLEPHFYESPYHTDSIKHGYDMAMDLFKANSSLPYTAIFASTDSNALGLLKACEEVGIRIPEDISMLGFDNIPYSGLPKIMLSTIEQPYKLMATAAVSMLIDKIDNPEFGYSHKILSPKLVVRSSCQKLD
ncbi:MAG TPA: LacI family transcriptional regulator [Ruminiclostridium sp.]|nr:LacI family transcriptional regulator [Ruminiclostridium sp.]